MLNFIRTLLSHPNRRAMKRPTAITVLECLERRELPAALMNPHRVSYQDKDGDMATVYFSLPLLTESNVNSIFKFDVGSVNNSLNSKQQLKQILIPADAVFDGLQISIELEGEADAIGNNQVDVGEIIANGVDLEAVNIEGDLGRIMVGDSNFSTAGLNSLNVVSLGNRGIATGARDSCRRFMVILNLSRCRTTFEPQALQWTATFWRAQSEVLWKARCSPIQAESTQPVTSRPSRSTVSCGVERDRHPVGSRHWGRSYTRISATSSVDRERIAEQLPPVEPLKRSLSAKNIDGGSGKYSGVINSLTGINAVTVMGSVVGNVEGSGAVRSWGKHAGDQHSWQSGWRVSG